LPPACLRPYHGATAGKHSAAPPSLFVWPCCNIRPTAFAIMVLRGRRCSCNCWRQIRDWCWSTGWRWNGATAADSGATPVLLRLGPSRHPIGKASKAVKGRCGHRMGRRRCGYNSLLLGASPAKTCAAPTLLVRTPCLLPVAEASFAIKAVRPRTTSIIFFTTPVLFFLQPLCF